MPDPDFPTASLYDQYGNLRDKDDFSVFTSAATTMAHRQFGANNVIARYDGLIRLDWDTSPDQNSRSKVTWWTFRNRWADSILLHGTEPLLVNGFMPGCKSMVNRAMVSARRQARRPSI
jgi:hypothetical protein